MTYDIIITMSSGTARKYQVATLAHAQEARALITEAVSSGGPGSTTTLQLNGQESVVIAAKYVALVEIVQHEDD